MKIMKTNEKNNSSKKTWIQYSIVAVVAITLYTTGLHTEVIGFAQRSLLATGLMNPDVSEIAMVQQHEGVDTMPVLPQLNNADYNLKLIDKEGQVRSLKEFKGKVIFLNLWATWCPPCVAEMPSIDKLHEEMGDEVAFVMLSLDDDFKKAKAFDKRKGYDLPIYALGSNLPTIFESTALPTTYVIDAKGNIALTHKGMADYSNTEFKDFLRSLM
jgi:thiol-disulfide isomerase/thioredoxin